MNDEFDMAHDLLVISGTALLYSTPSMTKAQPQTQIHSQKGQIIQLRSLYSESTERKDGRPVLFMSQ